MQRQLYWLCLIVPLVLLMGCSKNNPVSPSISTDSGKMMFALDAVGNIATGKVILTKGAITQFSPITISNYAGSVTFDSIQVGRWHILIQLFDADGAEIYTGESDAVVTQGQITTATIHVHPNTGHLRIDVEVPNAISPSPTATPTATAVPTIAPTVVPTAAPTTALAVIPTATPVAHTVKLQATALYSFYVAYNVNGTERCIYGLSGGGWSQTFTLYSGQKASVTAYAMTYYSDTSLSVAIFVDGNQVKHNSAIGSGASSCTCNYTIP